MRDARTLRFRGRLSAAGKPEEVLGRLRPLQRELAAIEQDKIDTKALDDVCRTLKQKEWLQHRSGAVRVAVACCLSDMLRLYAPNAPFSESEIAQVFAQFLAQLVAKDTGLAARDSPQYADVVYVLQSLSTVKSVALVCDVPAAIKLVSSYIAQLLTLAEAPLATNVQLFLTDVIIQLVEESAALPRAALDALMRAFDEDAPARRNQVAVDVCRAAQDRLQKYVAQYFAEAIREAYRDEDTDATLLDVYAQIVRIAKDIPSLLTSVVPMLEAELSAEDPATRHRTTDVLASLFALPLAKDPFAAMYPSTWQAWCKRALDKQASVRTGWVAGAFAILPRQPSLAAVLCEALSGRLGDIDERVRLAVAQAVGALEYEVLRHTVTTAFLRALAQRGKDRRAPVRDAALEALGRAYELAYPELRRDPGATEHFAWIPSAVLLCALAGTGDVIRRVAHVLDTYLLPRLPPAEHTARLVYIDRGLEADARAALYFYTNLRLARPSALDAFLAAWKAGEPDARAASLAPAASLLRDEPAQLEAMLAWTSTAAFALLEQCFAVPTTLEALHAAMDSLRTLVQSEQPALEGRVMAFARAGSYPLLNTSTVQPLLEAGADAARLRAYIAEDAPAMLAEHAAWLTEHAQRADAPSLAWLAALAAYRPATPLSERLASTLVDACSDDKVAVYAAQVLACSADAHARAMLPGAVSTLEERAALGTDTERASSWAALGAAAVHAPDAVHPDTLIEQILALLVEAWPADDLAASAPWPAHDVGPTAFASSPPLQLRLVGLAAMVDVCLGRADVERTRPVLKLAQALMQRGEARAGLATPPHAAARLRLAAAQSIVRLGTCAEYARTIVPRLARLAHALQDEQFEVRSGLLHALLRGLASGALPPAFHAALYIVALDPEDEMRARVLSYTRRAAAQLSESQRHVYFDLLFFRFLHLLAHHPDFVLDGDELVHFTHYIDFFLVATATPANVGTLAQCAAQLKDAVDATATPPNVAASHALYVVSELAQLVVQRYADAHGWDVPRAAPESLPTDILLPRTAPLEPPTFLSERLVESDQQQGKVRQHTNLETRQARQA